MSTATLTPSPTRAATIGGWPLAFLRGVLATWRRLPLKAKIGITILVLFILVAIFGPALAPYNPNTTTTQSVPEAPNIHHLFGTDSSGGDILSQMLTGTRSTVIVGLVTGVVATILSVLVGIAAGYLGGYADEGLSLFSNIVLVLPVLPLLIVILAYEPHSGSTVTIALLSALGWPWGARVIRAQTMSLRNRDFVLAAREVGEPAWRIIVFELMPNQIGLIAASFVGTVLYAILTSVALAFLGLTNLSVWSLGVILYWAQSGSAVELGAWWWYVFPGMAVAFLGMSLVLINFGLDELSNPRLRASRSMRKLGRRNWRPADPTPVILDYAELNR
ncbi:ABC transporter permease [Conexibacter sp. S30A1]|uniref:ABC transporter permease n=1 Tax=Conexibacter sp. S30A1 TaxID=2937800 RepID=UPI00200C6BDA|nr:ABC transporter permease [Conexibacter sp. S30A1]